MAYSYAVAANKPTAVTHSVVGNFTSPTDLNLILCKGTRFEVFLVVDDALRPLLDVGINGRISTISVLRFHGESQDSLFITTDRIKFCVLVYDSLTGEIKTRANGDAVDKVGNLAGIGQIGLVDPECRMLGMHIYDGFFKVIPIDERGQLQEAYNLRIEELLVIDIKFLYGAQEPTIVVLYQDTKSTRHIKTYQISLANADVKEGPWSLPNIEKSAEMIITLPLPFAGIIVIGEQSIIYHNGTTFSSLAIKPTIFKSYGLIDSTGERILLGDHLGRLFVLVLENDKKRITAIKLEPVGETSCASTVSYLHSGLVYIGSLYGDSQLIKLTSERDPDTGNYLDILDTHSNLGPIIDFCVVDLERQGQCQIVTCSGAFKDGSLRVVRNGIGIHEHAIQPCSGIKGIWSLNPPTNSSAEKYLIMSFVGETRALSMQGEELDEVEIGGFNMDQQTIFCTNLGDNKYIQITNKEVYLIDAKTEKLIHSWKPSNSNEAISVAASNLFQILLAVAGYTLVLLEVVDDKLVFSGSKQLPHEISCLNINPVGNAQRAQLCAVGLWTEISVKILALPKFDEVRTVEIGGDVIPRSVSLTTFDDITYLMIAMGDGYLINYIYDLKSGELTNKKKVHVGTQPVTLCSFRSKGQENIFACSDRPTVVYHSNNKKLLYSNVNLREVSYMCDFNCTSFPDSLALATEDSLTIGTVDDIQKLHIRTVPLGETPRRICHSPLLKAFCVLTVNTHFEKGEEVETNMIKLVNDQTFEILDSFVLPQTESVCSVITMTFLQSNEIDVDNSKAYFVVGTAFVLPTEAEPSKGRILVFSVFDNKLYLAAEKPVAGSVYSLNDFNGKLLAGINSKVQLFSWKDTEDGAHELSFESEHATFIIALHVATKGDYIIVGDLMKSITLLLYSPIDGVIKEVARDYHTNWMTACEMFDTENFIGAENSYNFFTLKKNNEAILQEDRQRLELTGEYHFGEFVNRFRAGSLVMKPLEGEGLNVSTLVCCCVSGVIGLVGQISEEQYNFLNQVQEALNKVIKGVGGFSHQEWRSFTNDRRGSVPSHGFIDGNLIETFLDLPAEQQRIVANSIDVSLEDLTRNIESISRAIH